jgi:hypothetical protein
MKMVRKQVYITPEQDRKLKECSQRLGVPEAEVIRRGIDLLEDEDAAQEAERLTAWRRVLSMMEERDKIRPESGGIDHFDREEVYAERLDRLGRIPG